MDATGSGRPTPDETTGTTVLFGPETEAALETHYLVIPDEVWRTPAEPGPGAPPDEERDHDEYEEDSRDPRHPGRQRAPMSRAMAGGIGGVATSLVAGVLPSLFAGPAAALVGGVVAGVFGGLMGHSVGVEIHDRKHRTDDS
ncbi:MAG: hypothetical protein ABW215_09265 [Kibdelosporangium sp.]